MKFNKLVRDKIPEIIEKNGNTAVTKTVTDDYEYAQLLKEKLNEEVSEYYAEGNIEELADVLEVVDAMAALNKHRFDDILPVKAKKRDKRGGFENRIYLVNTESNDENRYKDFQIRKPTFIPGAEPKDKEYFLFNYDLVKWRVDNITGEEFCFSIASLRYDTKESCWNFESVSDRYLMHREDGLEDWLKEWCERKGGEIESYLLDEDKLPY